jgi:hypothetical protein
MDIQNYPRCECLRTSEWKYIRYFARAEDPDQSTRPFKGTLDNYQTCLTSTIEGEQPVYEELYCLKTDPNERNNRIEDLNCRDILDRLRKRLMEHLLCAARGSEDSPLNRFSS